MHRILLAAALAAATPATAETVAIQAGRVIADASKPALGASTIIVANGRILRIDSGATAPAGARVVDLRGKTVMPGLIDAHVHLTGDAGTPFWREATDSDEYATLVGAKNALVIARAGFTTIRELGSAQFSGFALRDAIAQGLVPGPRVVAAGQAISIVGGHGDVNGFRANVLKAMDGNNTCTGADQCAERVRQMSKLGANVIKITATGGVLSQQGRGLEGHFTRDEIKAITTTAHTLGLKVAAHAHGARGIEDAAAMGVDSIEHGTYADAAGLKAMKAGGTWYVPTLMAFTGLTERIGKGVYTPVVEAKAKQALERLGQGLKAAKASGVRIAYGTDAGVFEHARAGEEGQMMVEYGGMTPREVLVAGTKDAAELLGIASETGTLEPGKAADIVAVDGDPLSDARALTRIAYVMAAGREVPLR
jgi:imidazolonepropionase-like amidohydrolase